MPPMNGHEFLKRLKRLAKRQGVEMHFDPSHGKGSHGLLLYGENLTTLKNLKAEISPGLLRKMLNDLGIDRL